MKILFLKIETIFIAISRKKRKQNNSSYQLLLLVDVERSTQGDGRMF